MAYAIELIPRTSVMRARLCALITSAVFFPFLVLTTLSFAQAAELMSRKAMSPDGIEIAYWEGGSGELTLVFVHGWTCDHSYWSEQLPVFARDYHVVAVDLGGHGDSALGRASYSMGSFGADVAAAVAGDGPVVLIGHSMGGPVILQAAQLLGDRVRGMVAVDTLRSVAQPAASAEQMQARIALMEQDYKATAGPAVASMFVENSDSDLQAEIMADMLATDEFVGVSAILGMYQMDVPASLTRLDAPMVVINSSYQPTDLAALVALHANTTLQLMDGVGHFVMMEDPQTFNRLLQQALDSF